MIVDDSTVARAVLSRMIESDSAFEISAVAGTAEDAIEALGQVRVDIVVLDLEMPGAGGLAAMPRIIGAAAGAKVMIVSSLAEEGAEQTVAALALGAADTLPKPGTGRFNGKFSEVLLGKLKALGYAQAPALAPVNPATLNPEELLRPMPSDPIDLLAIGASTAASAEAATPAISNAGSLSTMRDNTARATVESSTIMRRIRRRADRELLRGSGKRSRDLASARSTATELRRRRRAEA